MRKDSMEVIFGNLTQTIPHAASHWGIDKSSISNLTHYQQRNDSSPFVGIPNELKFTLGGPILLWRNTLP